MLYNDYIIFFGDYQVKKLVQRRNLKCDFVRGGFGVKTYACGGKSVTSYDAAEIAAYDIADERCGERERNGVAQPLYLRLGKVYR